MKGSQRALGFVLIMLLAGTVIGFAAVPQDTLRTTGAGVTTQVLDYLNATNYYRGTVNLTGYILNANPLGNANFSSIEADDFYIQGLNRTDALYYPEQPASYIIWRDGAVYYAKNGTTGVIVYNGNNIATVTQSAINSLSNGGLIHYNHGTYTFSATVDWPTDASEYTAPIIIEGDGWSTVLTRSANVPIFTLDGGANRCRNIVLKNLQLRSGTSTGELLRFVHADRIRIEDVLSYATQANSYHIYAEDTWDVTIYGTDFHGGGNTTRAMAYLYNGGAGDNCNNWRFTESRFERGKSFNSLAIHSDACGAGTKNHNIHITDCKFHGESDGAFTSGAIKFDYTIRSSVKDSWLTHHQGNGIDVDQNSYLNDFIGDHFLVYATQTPNSFIHVDGNNTHIEDILTQGSPTQIILLGSNSTQVTVRNIESYTANIVYVNDDGTNNIFPTIKGDFTHYGGGSSGWIAPVLYTSPAGISIDADNEWAWSHVPLPNDIHQVIRITVWGYSNTTEAVNNMRLRVQAAGGGSSQSFNNEFIDVPNHSSEEEGGIAQYDVIHWVIDETDDADLDDLLPQDFLEISILGEAAGAPDIATEALFGGWIIDYI